MMGLCVLLWLTLFCSSLAIPTRFLSNDVYSDIVAELRLQQISTGTCSGAGHTHGCCVPGPIGCRVSTGNTRCYCDRNCHKFHDCCSDIESIGCLPNTCSLAGLSRGCCTWSSGNSCFVRGGRCYCDRLCRLFHDCCQDVPRRILFCPATVTTPSPTTPTTPQTTTPLPTTPQPTTPLPTTPQPTTPLPTSPHTCIGNGHVAGGGCCSSNDCSVDKGDGFCYCDRECHREGPCCEDIHQINCFPRSCAEAGKTFPCAVTGPESCKVITSEGVCYCDANCVGAPGRPEDCCNATLLTSGDLFRVNQRMRMEQLAKLMSSYRLQDWLDSRAASLRQRYQAGLLARMQDSMDRPDFDPNYPPYYYNRKR